MNQWAGVMADSIKGQEAKGTEQRRKAMVGKASEVQ